MESEILIIPSTHGFDVVGFARQAEEYRIRASVGSSGWAEIMDALELEEMCVRGHC